MRTRRSKARTVTPFANPERQFHARREFSPAPIHNIYSFYESGSSESDTENVDIETLTLEQYLALDLNNTRRRFTCPDNLTFEIKGQLLRELCKISFSGGPTDSVVEHINNVLEIASIFNAQESTLIQVFPLTLEGIAKSQTRRTVDSNGLIPGLTDSDALKSIQKLVEHLYKWHCEDDHITTLNPLRVITEKLKLLNHEMKELKLDFRKMNTDDARKKYYVEVKSIRSSEINYDKTDTKASNRPTNLKDKFEQCLKESGERQEIQNEWMKKITTIKRRILEENKEPTTTHDKPKQQLQKLVSHDINDLPTSYSATLQSKLPPKETDPGSFILPCIIENHSMSNALADLGASISVMAIKMADRSMQSPKGIKENVLVKISNFVFLVDFIILDIIEDANVPIILGRPMLATAHAKIDVYGKKISLGVGNDQVVFNINKRESPASISPICVINEFDKTQELDSLGDFEKYLSPKYESQDIISLSPSESAEIKKDFSMMLCDLDKRMSIGLEEFVDIDDMWDDLDPGNEYKYDQEVVDWILGCINDGMT
ncbi:homeodomain-like protein [Tanacetum coccineum]